MNPLDALWHLANFFAPAWAVAVMLAACARLLWRRELKGRSWLNLVFRAGLGASLGLLAALALLGHDGRMAGYGLMLAGASLPIWWLTIKKMTR